LTRRTSFRSRQTSRPGSSNRYSSPVKFFGLAQTGPSTRTDENGYAPHPTVQSVVTVVDEEEGKRRKRERSDSRGSERKRRRTSPGPVKAVEEADSAETRRKFVKKLRSKTKKNSGLQKRNQRFFGRSLSGHLQRAVKENYRREKKAKRHIEKKAQELLEKQRQEVDESARDVLLQKLATKRKDNDAVQNHFNWLIQRKQNSLLCAKLKSHYEVLAKFLWTNAAGTSISWHPADLTGKEDVFEALRSTCRARLMKDFETEVRHVKENEPEEPELPDHLRAEQKKEEEKETKEKDEEPMEADFPLTDPVVKEEE